MEKLFNGIYWVFNTGWEIWSGLFTSLPYGDPYIAVIAAMIAIHLAFKAIYPTAQSY